MAIQPFATQIQAPQIQTPNPINQMGQLMALRDAQQQNQLRGMQMGQLQQGIEQENALRSFLGGGSDLSTPEAQSRLLSYGTPGIAAQKALRESETASLTGTKTRLEIADKTTEQYRNALTGLNVTDPQAFLDGFNRLTTSVHSNPVMQSIFKDSGASYEQSMKDALQAAQGGPEAMTAFAQRVSNSAATFHARLKPETQMVDEGEGGQRLVSFVPGQQGVTDIAKFQPKPRAAGTTIIGERAGVNAEAKILEEGLTKLGNVTGQLANVDAVRQAIPGARGMMGTGATALTATANFLKNRLNVQFDADALGALTDTAKIGSLLFQAVVDNLKSLDAAPSQSQQAAMQEAFGRISTDPDALYEVMDVYETAIRNKVASHNSRVDRASEGINKQFFRIDLPPKETPPEAPPKDAAKQPAEKKTKSGVAYTVEG